GVLLHEAAELEKDDGRREEDGEREAELLRRAAREAEREPGRDRRTRAREATEGEAEPLDEADRARGLSGERLRAPPVEAARDEDHDSGGGERARDEGEVLEEVLDLRVGVGA